MTILITGGAGYIGSVVVKQLASTHDIVVVDNLVKGDKSLLSEEVTFYEIDTTNYEQMKEVFKKHSLEAVIHFAAYKAVGESMKNAGMYVDNVIGISTVLKLMAEYEVKKIIFSSTAAVYGLPKEQIVSEKSPTVPINYYGQTKLTGEEQIKWFGTVHGIEYTIFRYFNVGGDGGLHYIDPHAQNILPIIMETVFGKRDEVLVFGDDFDTKDGTGVRDYIHVVDLARAHIDALSVSGNHIINLGTSKGYSVLELLQYTSEIAGKKIPYKIVGRREGDPDKLLTINKKAKEILDWEPKKTIQDIVKDTYIAYKAKQ